MDYIETSKGLKIPKIGLGTAGIGGGRIPDKKKDAYFIESIRYALDAGYSLIDTAEIYGGGHTEEIIGEAIEPYDRGSLFIITKVSGEHLKYDQILEAMERSHRRLRTHYVDLYLIHWPSEMVPIRESMRAMELLVEQGKTRFIGVSNFNKKQMDEANSSLISHEIVANEVHYSLSHHEPEKEIIPYCQSNDIVLISYSPLEKGELTRVHDDEFYTMMKKYGKTEAQISLNWLISQKNVTAIPKSTNHKHLMENLGSIGWRLEDIDANLLRKLKV